jgi:hypothetical protein
MKTRSNPQVIWPTGFDERAAAESSLKGWLGAQVELDDGHRYVVYFSDPIRLQQDVDEAVHEGKPCFAEPGLVIVPEVTTQAIEDAVQFLWKQGFFAALKTEQGEELGTISTAPNKRAAPHRGPVA